MYGRSYLERRLNYPQPAIWSGPRSVMTKQDNWEIFLTISIGVNVLPSHLNNG